MEFLFDDIIDLSRAISIGVDALLADLELGHARWQVLKWVAGGEDRTVGGIAKELGHSRQAVQRIVNELCELGLIRIAARTRRTVSPSLASTPKGEEGYFEADARILAWCDHLQMKFTGCEFDRGREFIVRLRDGAKEIDDDAVVTCRQNATALRRESDT